MRDLLARCLLSHRFSALQALAQSYSDNIDPEGIAQIQLKRFNIHWENAWRNIPFYMAWKQEFGLPDQIDDIRALADFPVLTKSVLYDRRDLVERTPFSSRRTLTGGTSGVSTSFPMNNQDAFSSWLNTHLGRYWNNILPDDRLFMIWGHSHLFSGKGARLKQIKRRFKDWVVNIDRASAYNLTNCSLDVISKKILSSRPSYVIAYGSCLAELSHYLEHQACDLNSAGVRRVVNTSETISTQDADSVARVFGCPVINEYGMAEAGVIGYSVASLYPIKIFWRDFIITTSESRLLLTSIGNRCFPLINYETGDSCDDITPEFGSILELHSLKGKSRDVFSICDVEGRCHDVSVVLFDHILKQVEGLRSLHYTLLCDGRIKIEYTSNGLPLSETELHFCFASGLAQEGIVISPQSISFNRIEAPLQTVAGKRITLRREKT